MVTKLVIALCLFSNGALIEHTLQPSMADCLEKKRIMERNMRGGSNRIMCGEVLAELEEINGVTFIKSIQKTGN